MITKSNLEVTWVHINKTVTICLIRNRDYKDIEVSRGLCKLHPLYQFNRKIGVFLSFKRAVKNITHDEAPQMAKKIRTELWETFWEIRKVKPQVILVEDTKSLRNFLEQTTNKKNKRIEDKYIKFTIPQDTEIWYPRND